VIEHITSQPFADFMRSHILDPLALHESSYIWRTDYSEKIADGHDEDGRPVEKEKPKAANAAYTLHTTAEEFARFILSALHPSDAVTISDALRNEMLSPQIAIADGVSWGFGWGLCQDAAGTSLWHWGDNKWFTCFAVGWPEQQSGMVLMTNSVFGLQACREILASVLGQDYAAFAWLMYSFYGNT
jgi:CubicO group peptidase (beta-lactamase class C family)